ncbi:MAG: hypothetical protein L0H64_15670 [Pseudonocardia sp.]|nr:hypothetical protein [Pseudonocardia sp.]
MLDSPSFVLLLLPAVVLTVGLLAVALPRARAAYVERRFGLTRPDRPILTEIERFLAEHGAQVEVQ